MNGRKFLSRRKFLPALFAIIGAIVFLNLLGQFTFDVNPFQVILAVDVGFPGQTTLEIPPIGTISANTHWVPTRISATLKNIDLEKIRAIVFTTDQAVIDTLVQQIVAQSRRIITIFVLQLLVIAGTGSIIGILVLGNRKCKILARGFLIGVTLTAVILGATYLSFDRSAFTQPTYQGIIEAAPWMIELMQESVGKVEELGQQIQNLASNLYIVFQQIEELKTVGNIAADLTVLHVSDIHNHPVAYDFTRQVVASFPIDLVIDTGDLTDWGTPLEARIIEQIEGLAVTYVFTSGNHDAPDVIERLKQTKNVVLITDSQPKQILGLTIAGIGDPAASSYSPTNAPITELAEIARTINDYYREQEDHPDIFGVHNHRIASAIEPGLFDAVVYGHNHLQSIQQINETVYIDAGTTGAAGIRGIQGGREQTPFSLAILYYQHDVEKNKYQLIAVDGISVQGFRASFSLNRIFINHEGRIQDNSVESLNKVFD